MALNADCKNQKSKPWWVIKKLTWKIENFLPICRCGENTTSRKIILLAEIFKIEGAVKIASHFLFYCRQLIDDLSLFYLGLQSDIAINTLPVSGSVVGGCWGCVCM